MNKTRKVYCPLPSFQTTGGTYPLRHYVATGNVNETTYQDYEHENRIDYFSAAALSLFAFTASAHSVTATGNTLDSAEAVIAKKAKELNATDYKITSAHMGNKVTMSAVLDK